MEIAAKSNSKRMYSWWWDSHNTPKNSKWLQDNLAGMFLLLLLSYLQCSKFDFLL